MKLFDHIDKAQRKLQGPPIIYMAGNHVPVTTENIEKNFIVSSKGMPEKFKILKKSISEAEFQTSVKGVAEMPSIIVHVVEIEDDNIQQVNEQKIR